MSVQVVQQYQFNDDIPLKSTALQIELSNIQQVINNANFGLLTWDVVKAVSVTFINPVAIPGTQTNNNAVAGNVGEAIRSAAAGVSISSSATYVNIVSISLTAGDWDISGNANLITTGVTLSGSATLAISKNTGNTTTDHVSGDNVIAFGAALGADAGAAIPVFRVSLAATTIYYLKTLATFSVGTPTCEGRISARRVR